MRNKVFLIRGCANLAPKITLAEFERINADHICLIAGLRRPHTLPETINSAQLLDSLMDVLEHWFLHNTDHHLKSEYADVALEHGGEDIKVVEGECLRFTKFFDFVESVHKSFGQRVIDCEVTKEAIRMGHSYYTVYEFIELVKPDSKLG